MRRAVVLGVVAAALVLSGCGDDAPSDYNADVEESFLQTCTDQGGDDLQDVCQCAYDSFEEQIPFDRFQRVDERLSEDPDAELPDDFLDLYTDCVIQDGGGSAGTTPQLPTTTTTAGPTTTVPGVTDTTVAP
ncbi:MAG: hypothetical protein H6518_09600 [Microthrixaceae bacterium]|nr:hypothetical protein [Microthrixaceae bacterium]